MKRNHFAYIEISTNYKKILHKFFVLSVVLAWNREAVVVVGFTTTCAISAYHH
jgi:hypothetical protein